MSNPSLKTPLEAVVLAAGKGTRMRSEKPKVLHELGGEPLLAHVLRAVRQLRPSAVHVVLGHEGDRVRERFPAEKVNWVEQIRQLGTGHAVKTALPAIQSGSTVLVVYGDVPLIPAAELALLADRVGEADLALLTAELEDPQGYGRIVRDAAGGVIGIVEHNDATAEQLELTEINTGFIAAGRDRLAEWLGGIADDNAQCEQYLTDIVAIASRSGCKVAALRAQTAEAVMGVNTKSELAFLEQQYRQRRAAEFLDQGVTLADPKRFDARGEVSFGRDCFVDVGVVLEGPMVIGNDVQIGPHSVLRGSTLGDGVRVRSHSVIEDATLHENVVVGPFARIRPGTRLREGAHIGNFVELKNSDVGPGSKINHLSYVGDSRVGSGVNIGAGVITCNYDGAAKHRTEIEDDVFIGSSSQLVAPVKVGRGATVGAGSTITKDVPPGGLAVARVRQRNLADWVSARKKRAGRD